MKKAFDYMPWVTLLLVIPFFIFLLWIDAESYRDRAGLHEALKLQREMLDARAEIQIMNVRATAEGRAFTKWETARFNELCRKAEYEKIPGGCAPLR